MDGDNQPMTSPRWVAALEADAPDVVACRRVSGPSLCELKTLRRERRARAAAGAAPRILAQEEAVGDALGTILRDLPEALLRLLEKSRGATDHPLVGHPHCGEWLPFIGIHDLMHLEPLHRLRNAGG